MLDDDNSDEESDDSGEDDSDEHTIEIYKQNMGVVDNEDLGSTEEIPVYQEIPEKKTRSLTS